MNSKEEIKDANKRIYKKLRDCTNVGFIVNFIDLMEKNKAERARRRLQEIANAFNAYNQVINK
jgi:hypothetical protein